MIFSAIRYGKGELADELVCMAGHVNPRRASFAPVIGAVLLTAALVMAASTRTARADCNLSTDTTAYLRNGWTLSGTEWVGFSGIPSDEVGSAEFNIVPQGTFLSGGLYYTDNCQATALRLQVVNLSFSVASFVAKNGTSDWREDFTIPPGVTKDLYPTLNFGQSGWAIEVTGSYLGGDPAKFLVNYASSLQAYSPPPTTTSTSTTNAVPSTVPTTTIPPPPPVAPGAPTNLRVTGRTTSSISIAWGQPSGNVVRYEVAVPAISLVQSVTSTSFTASGLESNKSYTFSVVAIGSNGLRSSPATITGTTLPTYRARVDGIDIDGEIGATINLNRFRPGKHAWVTVHVTNIGTATWKNSGSNPVRIATTSPRDRGSVFATPSWISWTRAATLDQATVAPNGAGTFTFMIEAPDVGIADYTEKFNLVSEGNTWFEKPEEDFVAFTATIMPIVGITSSPDGDGYWGVDAEGYVFSHGAVSLYGSMYGKPLNAPIVAIESTKSGNGYWLVGADGGVFAFGDAGFYGSAGNKTLNQPVVGMARTPSGKGYWLVAADGGIFTYGDAPFLGSTGGKVLNKPIVGMAATPTRGYWLVAEDGGIFTFGDAAFYGSMGGKTLNQPVVGMARTSTGKGYWLAAKDGGIFTFGDAKFHGSLTATPLDAPIIGITATPDGYWLMGRDASVFKINTSHVPTVVSGTTATGCGHAGNTGYGPLANCSGLFSDGVTVATRTASGVTCQFHNDGTYPIESSAARYRGLAVSDDGSGMYMFYGGPKVTTAFGTTSYGEQRWVAPGYGPLVRWGNFNFEVNRFFPGGDWMADTGPITCPSLTKAP
jgi:hypothetical protein